MGALEMLWVWVWVLRPGMCIPTEKKRSLRSGNARLQRWRAGNGVAVRCCQDCLKCSIKLMFICVYGSSASSKPRFMLWMRKWTCLITCCYLHNLITSVSVCWLAVIVVFTTTTQLWSEDRVPTLLLTKLSRTFPGPFRSPRMFKYKRHLLPIFRV